MQLKFDFENQEQYTDNNTLGGTVSLFMVIPKEQEESTDSIVLNAFNKHLEEGLTEVDIYHTHRTGKSKQNKHKPRPIIIEFVRYNSRRRIFLNKKT